MSFKPLVLATLLATVLPGAAGAFSMRCDDPDTLRSSRHASHPGRDFLAQRRHGLPEWVKERRSHRFEHRAPRTSPIERPSLPDWVRERRGKIARPQRPELPDWLQERRSARPTLGSTPGSTLGPIPGSTQGLPRFRQATAAPRKSAPALESGRGLPRRFGTGPFPGWGGPARVGPGWGAPRWAGPAWGGPARRGPGWAGPGRFGHRYPWPLRPPVTAAPVTVAPDDAVEPAEEVARIKVAVAVAAAPAPKPAPRPAPVDADQDGVASPADLCPDSAAGARVDAFGCEQNAAIVLRGVNFKTDSAELTSESLAILDGVSGTLVANPGIKVEVAGHTDSDGDDAYNKDLSQRRSESVVSYLAGKGVPAENMSAKGYGEEQPIAGNDSAEGKAQNRRVELNRL